MLTKIASGYFFFINILILLQSISIDSTTTEAKVDATSKIQYTFFYDNFDEAEVTSSEYVVVGRLNLRFPTSHNYKPDPNIDETISLTDYTSIDQRTSNDEFCIIPFQANGIDNNFCVANEENEEQYECETSSGRSNCTLGQFMLVIADRRNPFPKVNLQFMKSLNFEDDSFYVLEFKYLINYDICDENDVTLTFYLYYQDAFKEILFESNNTNATIENNKWNSFDQCFQIYSRSYYLFIEAVSVCEPAFIAVDEVVFRKLDESSLDISSCKDIRITERPPVEATTSEIKRDTTDSSTEFTIADPTTRYDSSSISESTSIITLGSSPSTETNSPQSSLLSLLSDSSLSSSQSSSSFSFSSDSSQSTPIIITALSTEPEINTASTQTNSENTISYQTAEPESTKSPDSGVINIYFLIAIIVGSILVISLIATLVYCLIVKPKKTIHPDSGVNENETMHNNNNNNIELNDV